MVTAIIMFVVMIFIFTFLVIGMFLSTTSCAVLYSEE